MPWRPGDRGRLKVGSEYLTPGQVALLFGVDRRTVGKWADDGTFDVSRTLGGHRRFRRDEVERVLNYLNYRSGRGHGTTGAHRTALPEL